jgi:hypothetical protein
MPNKSLISARRVSGSAGVRRGMGILAHESGRSER